MLPASPLHRLLARAVGAPLVCTSGNRSGEPLCIDPGEALQRLEGIADGVLHHDRPIARPLDDSLLQLVRGRPSLLRRARGYAPQPIPLPAPRPAADAPAVLALGGDLKAAPALALGSQVWMAAHQGDLADARSLRRWQAGLMDLRRRLPSSLQLVCDGHPGYLSYQVASAFEDQPATVPHHLAHGLAVVAEHGLRPPLLLVAFDGLGYGGPQGPGTLVGSTGIHDPDPLPSLRGGEVLRLDPGDGAGWTAATLASLLPFPLPGGVMAMREPRRSALGLLHRAGFLGHPGAWRLGLAFTAQQRSLLARAAGLSGLSPDCSSAGRLFDAAAALLGLLQVLRHEGEGGMRLQAAAQRALAGLELPGPEGLLLQAVPGTGRFWLDWRPLLEGLLRRALPGADRDQAAAWFHLALAEGLAAALASLQSCAGLPVVLSGGCFQNALLLEATLVALERRGLVGHWSERVPCNDGGLALGQIAAARWLAPEALGP
mgnify:CR=1 FL=1